LLISYRIANLRVSMLRGALRHSQSKTELPNDVSGMTCTASPRHFRMHTTQLLLTTRSLNLGRPIPILSGHEQQNLKLAV